MTEGRGALADTFEKVRVTVSPSSVVKVFVAPLVTVVPAQFIHQI